MLEVIMQTAGFVISSYQNYENGRELRKKSHYKIICLGESTTFRAYPVSLQKMLDEKYPGMFSVIDCGIPGSKIHILFDQLGGMISKYKPDFAICMIGINDGFIASDYDGLSKKNKYESLKIYKLYELLKQHLSAERNNINAFKPENEIEDEMKDVYHFYNLKKYSEAADICKKVLSANNANIHASAFLAMLYSNHLGNPDGGYEIASDALGKIDGKIPARIKDMLYEIVIEYRKKRNIQLQDIIEKLIDEEPEAINPKIYSFIKDSAYPGQKEKILKKMTEFKNYSDQYYGLMAIESMDGKDYKTAEEYFKTAEEIRMNYPNNYTYYYYKLIVGELLKNNVRVICMQYPVRSIEPLRKMFEKESYYGSLTFVSNEKSFKSMLKKNKYRDLFFDQFAGDFGHYNEKSGTIISKNIIAAVEKKLNK